MDRKQWEPKCHAYSVNLQQQAYVKRSNQRKRKSTDEDQQRDDDEERRQQSQPDIRRTLFEKRGVSRVESEEAIADTGHLDHQWACQEYADEYVK